MTITRDERETSANIPAQYYTSVQLNDFPFNDLAAVTNRTSNRLDFNYQ